MTRKFSRITLLITLTTFNTSLFPLERLRNYKNTVALAVTAGSIAVVALITQRLRSTSNEVADSSPAHLPQTVAAPAHALHETLPLPVEQVLLDAKITSEERSGLVGLIQNELSSRNQDVRQDPWRFRRSDWDDQKEEQDRTNVQYGQTNRIAEGIVTLFLGIPARQEYLCDGLPLARENLTDF